MRDKADVLMTQNIQHSRWKKSLASLLWKAGLFILLAPVVIVFFFAFLYGPDVAHSLSDFLTMWFFLSFAFVVNALAVAGILENTGVISSDPRIVAGPTGTVFYIAFATFLDYILLREAGLL